MTLRALLSADDTTDQHFASDLAACAFRYAASRSSPHGSPTWVCRWNGPPSWSGALVCSSASVSPAHAGCEWSSTRLSVCTHGCIASACRRALGTDTHEMVDDRVGIFRHSFHHFLLLPLSPFALLSPSLHSLTPFHYLSPPAFPSTPSLPSTISPLPLPPPSLPSSSPSLPSLTLSPPSTSSLPSTISPLPFPPPSLPLRPHRCPRPPYSLPQYQRSQRRW